MTKRLPNTIWLSCFLALQVGPPWHNVKCQNTKPPANGPATVEAQAKFFQDFFSVQLSPYKIEFGHVCEDPNTWEQRYESNDYQNHRTMGKVRWGDKKGGYGEHYWDLNHAGSGVTQQTKPKPGDEDNGAYDPAKYETDAFDEPSEQTVALQIKDTPTYSSETHDTSFDDIDSGKNSNETPTYNLNNNNEEAVDNFDFSNYDAQKSSYPLLDGSERRKRHHKKSSNKRHIEDYDDDDEEEVNPKKTLEGRNKNHKHRHEDETKDSDDFNQERTEIKKRKKKSKVKDNKTAEHQEKSKLENTEPSYTQPFYVPPKLSSYVPYVQGGGVRQPFQGLAAGPRLFLEPSSGHVVDRETGQAYILQPIRSYK